MLTIYSYFRAEFMFVVPRICVSNDVTCARCIALHANSYVCYISSIVSNNFAVSYSITSVVMTCCIWKK